MYVIDLSSSIYDKMTTYPGDPEVRITQVHTLQKQGWRLRKISMGTHTGTHLDAPSHMIKDGKTLDEIPLEQFFGEALKVSGKRTFPPYTNLIFDSGNLQGDILQSIIKAQPKLVGVGTKAQLPVESEKELLQNGIITVTDLINLEALPQNKLFQFFAIPLKIQNGDGSPVRAFAIV